MKMRFVTKWLESGYLAMLFTSADDNNKLMEYMPIYFILNNKNEALAILKEILEGKYCCFDPKGKSFRRVKSDTKNDEMFIEWEEVTK